MNIAIALKNEIVRLCRKELRVETQSLRKAVSTHRSEIAALKRKNVELQRQLQRLARPKPGPALQVDKVDSNSTFRYSAKGLTTHRKRLGLSAQELGLLLGVSGQSVYNWEAGQNRPRAKQITLIAALRTLGKKEAFARLEVLRGAAQAS